MKQVWQANDGAVFDNRDEAERHEMKTKARARLVNFFTAHISYSSDAGYSCATADEVADIIVDNIDEFFALMDNDDHEQ